jgi:glycosyltransferase involved in cell wall biosynthesis
VINVFCPYFGDFGLARHARAFVGALARLVDVALVSWNRPAPGERVPPEVEAWLARGRGDLRGNLGIGIGDMESMRHVVGRFRIAMTVWETTVVPPRILAPLLRMDEVWIPSEWGRQILIENGVPAGRVRVVPGGVDARTFSPGAPRARTGRRFRFLSVGKWEARKGSADLVRTFTSTFAADAPVELFLHGWHICMPDADLGAQVRAHAPASHAPVLTGPKRSDAEMLELYRSADAFVLATRAEGWGLPIIEAMACGLPVIVTDYSAHRAYATPEVTYLVRVRELVPVHDAYAFPTVSGPFGVWAQPDLDHLARLMRHVQAHPDEARQRGAAARDHVLRHFSWEAAARVAVARLDELAPGGNARMPDDDAYRTALREEQEGHPWPEVMQRYLQAHEQHPEQAAPLVRIGMHYQASGEPALAHLFLARAFALPRPDDDYQLPLEYAVACYYVGDHAGAIAVDNALLRSPHLPASLVTRVIENRRHSLDALAGAGAAPAAPVRLTIALEARGAGPELDDVIDSLVQQRHPAFEVHVLAAGADAELAAHLPAGDARFSLVPQDLPTWLARRDGDEVVLLLSPRAPLAGADALGRLAAAFAGPGVALVYGQHRAAASGRLGDAEPAPDEATFLTRGAALAGASPLAFRARLAASSAAPADSIWRAAGFAATRFLDDVLTLDASATTRVEGGAPPPARAHRAASAPVVSCLMITRDRLALAKRAMRCYAAQTWPERELVVVTAGSLRYARALEAYALAAGIEQVRVLHEPRAETTLGALRNRSLDAARGEVVLQWDDDDCHHSERIARQLECMRSAGARASFLSEHLQFLEPEGRVYWIDWSGAGRVSGAAALVPGTLMMYADPRFRYPELGPASQRGEDSSLLATLHAHVPVAHARGMGYLYLYQYHGANTFSKEHHYRISHFAVPRARLHEHAAELSDALAQYPIARPALVVGSDGPAFAVG